MYVARSPVITTNDSSIAAVQPNALDKAPHDIVTTTLADGRVVIVRTGVAHDDSVVRFEILDPAGVPLSLPQTALQIPGQAPVAVSVAAIGGGGFVVQGGNLAQRFDSSGHAVGPQIVLSGGGGEITAIGDSFVTVGATNAGLVTSVYNAVGQMVANRTSVLPTLGAAISDLQTSTYGQPGSTNGRIVSSWTETTLGLLGPQTTIRFQLLNGNADPIGLPFARLGTLALQPDVAFLKDGSFVVSFTDATDSLLTGSTPAAALYTQHFSTNGVALNPYVRVNSGGAGGADGVGSSTITALPNGGYLMTWSQGGQSYTREYSASDQPVGAQVTIGLTGVSDATLLQDGHVLAVDVAGHHQILTGSLASATAGLIGQTLSGTGGDDTLTATVVGTTLNGGTGSDMLIAAPGGRTVMNGGAGNDILTTGVGGNTIDGGDGFDVLNLAKGASAYWLEKTANGFVLHDGAATDTVTNVEGIVAGGRAYTLADFTHASFDPLAYIAGQPDLARGIGANAAAGYQHYLQYGQAEGRTVAFDPVKYLAANIDLVRAFGDDPAAAARHYIQFGMTEGRPTGGFDALEYAASNPDLARAYGTDTTALTLHYVREGAVAGRPTASFDPLIYAATNPDLARIYGSDTVALTRHYVEHGAFENRKTVGFDVLEYGASNVDLAIGYGNNREALLRHYVEHGVNEPRSINSFDALHYAATYTDLARGYGSDTQAALQHYLGYGALEGRNFANFDEVGYLLSFSDLAGKGPQGALLHWLDFGADEGRIGDSIYGREQATHQLIAGLLGGGVTQAIDTANDHDWFKVDLVRGSVVNVHLSGASSGGGSLGDSTIHLFDSTGRLLASDFGASGSSDANILISPAATGTYYVAIEGGTVDAVGSYTVTALGDTSGNTPTVGTIVAGLVTGLTPDVGGGLTDVLTGTVSGLTGGVGTLVPDLHLI